MPKFYLVNSNEFGNEWECMECGDVISKSGDVDMTEEKCLNPHCKCNK